MKTLATIGLALLLAGCSALPTDPLGSGDARQAAQLLRFADRIHQLDSPTRVEVYRQLANNLVDCQDPLPCLKLALLLEGVEPELTDLERSRTLLGDSLEAGPGPLLTAYIGARLAELDIRERERRQAALAQRSAASQRRQSAGLQSTVQELQELNQTLEAQVKALETKIDALTSIEQSLKEGSPAE